MRSRYQRRREYANLAMIALLIVLLDRIAHQDEAALKQRLGLKIINLAAIDDLRRQL